MALCGTPGVLNSGVGEGNSGWWRWRCWMVGLCLKDLLVGVVGAAVGSGGGGGGGKG